MSFRHYKNYFNSLNSHLILSLYCFRYFEYITVFVVNHDNEDGSSTIFKLELTVSIFVDKIKIFFIFKYCFFLIFKFK